MVTDVMDCQENQLSALEWKKLYLQLEGKIRHFRIRTVSIRSKLAIKMAELEFKVEQAEQKATNAESQLLALQNSMMVPGDVAAQGTKLLKKQLLGLESQCQEQSERIVVLEKQLENETFVRNMEQQALESKALRIKDWVLRVLRKAEKEKRELQAANDRLHTAVKNMQQRLTDVLGSSPELKGQAYTNEGHVSVEETSLSPLKSRQLTLAKKSFNEISSSGKHQPTPQFPTFPIEMDQSESIPNEPELRASSIERKNMYETISDIPSLNTNDSKTAQLYLDGSSRDRDSVAESANNQEETDLMTTVKDLGPKRYSKPSNIPISAPGCSPSKSDSENSNPGHTYYNIMGTFDSIRRKFKGLADSHQKSRPFAETQVRTIERGREKRLKPKLKTNERRRSTSSKTKTPARKISVASLKKEDSLQKEDQMMTEQLSSSFPASHCTWKHALRQQPPPVPPPHRHPGIASMEARIREIADAAGFKIPSSFLSKSQKLSPCKPESCDIGKYEELIYQKHPFAVPVFGKIDGNSVQQLRPTPFSDASESSDEDIAPYAASSGRRLSPRRLQHIKSNSNDSLAHKQRRNGSPGNARAIKRGNSQQSITSSESDYAIPPDAHGITPSTPTDNSEPEHKLIKTSKHSSIPSNSRMPSFPSKRADMDFGDSLKCGYLNKLSGKSRTWTRRWFVVRNGRLFCFKSSNDVTKKAQREIVLDRISTTIKRDNSNYSIIRITAGGRNYYLSAESSKSATEWMTVLQAAGATSISGWVVRTIGESECRTWTIVRSGVIEFYESEADEVAFDSFNLGNCKIEEAQLNLHLPTLPAHTRAASAPFYDHVLIVRSQTRSRDTYLSFETAKQKILWLHAMTSSTPSVTSTKSRKLEGSSTEYEKLVLKVLQSGNRARSHAGSDTVWLHPILSHSKQGITRPLTSLSSDALKTEAMKIAKSHILEAKFVVAVCSVCGSLNRGTNVREPVEGVAVQSIQLFTNETLGSDTVDYHVTLVQCIAQSCLTHSELRNEVYSQLIKETNRKKQQKNDENDSAHLQAWKLLSLLIPIFLPQNEWKLFLRNHLSRNADKKSTVGQYVIYCQRSVERCLSMGGRAAPPSRAESLSILLQKPYQHSLPLSVPVHFADGSYEVVSFDCSTTVEEFSKRVTKQSGLREHIMSGFALHVDNPDHSKLIDHHLLEPSVKICDVISLWETVVRHDLAIYKTLTLPQDCSTECTKSPKFVFKRHLFSNAMMKHDNAKEKYLLFYQIAHNISRDLIPLSRDLAVEMTSLALLVACGEKSNSMTPNIDQFICKFYPTRYQGKNFLRQVRERILSRWEALEGVQMPECLRIFLSIAKKWPHSYTKLYQAQHSGTKSNKSDAVWLSVGANNISILQFVSMEVMESIDYSQIITFGGCKDHLLLVLVSSGVSRKLLFDMNQIEMLELVNTVSEYMKLAGDSTLENMH